MIVLDKTFHVSVLSRTNLKNIDPTPLFPCWPFSGTLFSTAFVYGIHGVCTVYPI